MTKSSTTAPKPKKRPSRAAAAASKSAAAAPAPKKKAAKRPTAKPPAAASPRRRTEDSAPAAAVSVNVRSSVRRVPELPALAIIRQRVTKMLHEIQMDNCEVSIVLTDDEEIQMLNREYRGIDRTTDVLSFSMIEGEGAQWAGSMLGDVVISVPQAVRQASAAQRPLLDEATMLLAHGLLHLVGWDHRTPAEDRKMRARTDQLCVAVGAPPLFALGGVDREGRSQPTRKSPAAEPTGGSSLISTSPRKTKSPRTGTGAGRVGTAKPNPVKARGRGAKVTSG